MVKIENTFRQIKENVKIAKERSTKISSNWITHYDLCDLEGKPPMVKLEKPNYCEMAKRVLTSKPHNIPLYKVIQSYKDTTLFEKLTLLLSFNRESTQKDIHIQKKWLSNMNHGKGKKLNKRLFNFLPP